MRLQDAREQLIRCGKYLIDQHLAWGSSGNVSVRLSPARCLMTSSGSRLGSLTYQQLAIVDFAGEVEHMNAAESDPPSKEVGMHIAAYRARPEWNAVVHVSPRYSTLIACAEPDAEEAGVPLGSRLFPEGMMHLRSLGRVPYAHAGSAELAKLVGEAAATHDVILLENHGVVAGSDTLDQALLKVETLEFAAFLYVSARSAGIRLRDLPQSEVDAFLRSRYRR